MNTQLEVFYDNFQKKPIELRQAEFDALHKYKVIFNDPVISTATQGKTLVDFGCGFGKFLSLCVKNGGIERGFGFDFSKHAISHATQEFGDSKTSYTSLSSLDPGDVVREMKAVLGDQKVDCISLIDLLEHVPDVSRLIAGLSVFTKSFLIKLPIEDTFFNNYVFPKHYPSVHHYNGHLREFTCNSVFRFIRKLGLEPQTENLYKENFMGAYPFIAARNWFQIFRNIPRILLNEVPAFFLPKRLYLRLFSGGCYYCLATYNEKYILNP